MGGTYAVDEEVTEGPLNLVGGLLGLNPEACVPATDPDDIESMVFWGG